MSYGLYDGDMLFYKGVPFFNLELMKLSSYYKRKREIINLSPKFNPNMYSNFIVRQDYPFSNPNISYADNVSFGGRAYDGDEYKPLPLEIEVMKPDTQLYNKIENDVAINKNKASTFSVMRRAEHLRLSLDGKTIWKDYQRQLRRDKGTFGVIFHDYDLGQVQNSFELVRELIPEVISHANGRRIGMKFPVQVNNETDLLKWLSLSPMGQFYSLQYNGILSLNNIEQIKELNKNSSAVKQTVINVTGNQNYQDFISTGLEQVFKRILDLRREGISFPLIYGKEFFADKRWEEVMKLIKLFSKHIHEQINTTDYRERIAPYETFYSYVKTLTKEQILYGSILPKRKVQEIFQFVRENNYELFVAFYEYHGEKTT